MTKKCVAILVLFLFCGCAPKFDYKMLQTSMRTGNCPGSVELLKNSRSSYGNKAVLLHLLDSGMIHFQCGNFDQATHFFSEADQLAQQLWTKSLSQEAASYVTNDLILPYRGEDFERALINLLSAFSYIKLGEYDEAMADCRRLDTVLTEYNSKYEKKNVYKEDALGRYISGILSEADHEYSEAYIYYYQSLMAFKNYNENYQTVTPQCLYEDLLRVSAPADRKREARRLVPNARAIKYTDDRAARKLGKIVLIHMNGKAPVKFENKFTANTPSGPISIAFPVYRSYPPSCHYSKLILTSETDTIESTAVLFEDVNKIALKDLADRKVRITAKAIARAVVKQAVVQASSDEVEKQHGEMAGFMTKLAGNVVSSVLEKADTRCWRTLPGEIYIARAFVPPGNYRVSAENCHGGKKVLDALDIKAGETKFVFYDTIY